VLYHAKVPTILTVAASAKSRGLLTARPTFQQCATKLLEE
jgi:hypothetical protein